MRNDTHLQRRSNTCTIDDVNEQHPWGPTLPSSAPLPTVAPMPPPRVQPDRSAGGRPSIAISEEQLGQALANGWTVRDIGIKLGCSESTLRRRIAEARITHGALWGAGAPEAGDDPAELLRMRLSSPPPSVADTRALAKHAVHWGLETGTRDSASIVRAALTVLESPEFRTVEGVEAEEARRARLLETIIRGLSGAGL